ncbi:hemerythrin domain-containing protein [Aquicoccus sp. G2-2]|uniref:hemerythrin domain-containing protein n=1 Tax=Aquicoccus sp. G2-2 TaxID=3092120 RepID=UPI002AE0A69E|nr:hemerythrin domain-containing protein [Aquicoccus sp. G2-2]MEA1113501.1 hemerythrin domain-containing protein [Aquicoccus sp. G2-2]
MTETATLPDSPPVDDATALTHYIETRYHARHREQMPALAEMAERIETVHFGDENLPTGLATLLRRMIGELEVHMKKEELILFPTIRRGGTGAAEPIAAMRADHDDQDTEVADIRRLTNGLTLPQGACQTWAKLYAGLDEFLTDLEAHLSLENDVLFPPFEQGSAA